MGDFFFVNGDLLVNSEAVLEAFNTLNVDLKAYEWFACECLQGRATDSAAVVDYGLVVNILNESTLCKGVQLVLNNGKQAVFLLKCWEFAKFVDEEFSYKDLSSNAEIWRIRVEGKKIILLESENEIVLRDEVKGLVQEKDKENNEEMKSHDQDIPANELKSEFITRPEGSQTPIKSLIVDFNFELVGKGDGPLKIEIEEEKTEEVQESKEETGFRKVEECGDNRDWEVLRKDEEFGESKEEKIQANNEELDKNEEQGIVSTVEEFEESKQTEMPGIDEQGGESKQVWITSMVENVVESKEEVMVSRGEHDGESEEEWMPSRVEDSGERKEEKIDGDEVLDRDLEEIKKGSSSSRKSSTSDNPFRSETDLPTSPQPRAPSPEPHPSECPVPVSSSSPPSFIPSPPSQLFNRVPPAPPSPPSEILESFHPFHPPAPPTISISEPQAPSSRQLIESPFNPPALEPTSPHSSCSQGMLSNVDDISHRANTSYNFSNLDAFNVEQDCEESKEMKDKLRDFDEDLKDDDRNSERQDFGLTVNDEPNESNVLNVEEKISLAHEISEICEVSSIEQSEKTGNQESCIFNEKSEEKFEIVENFDLQQEAFHFVVSSSQVQKQNIVKYQKLIREIKISSFAMRKNSLIIDKKDLISKVNQLKTNDFEIRSKLQEIENNVKCLKNVSNSIQSMIYTGLPQPLSYNLINFPKFNETWFKLEPNSVSIHECQSLDRAHHIFELHNLRNYPMSHLRIVESSTGCQFKAFNLAPNEKFELKFNYLYETLQSNLMLQFQVFNCSVPVSEKWESYWLELKVDQETGKIKIFNKFLTLKGCSLEVDGVEVGNFEVKNFDSEEFEYLNHFEKALVRLADGRQVSNVLTNLS
jgi:hypothetical protein